MSNAQLKPITRKQWIEALKSGEYKQGKNALWGTNICGEKRFCCIGVAADLMGVDTNDLSVEYATCYLDAFVPDEFSQAIGLAKSPVDIAGRDLNEILAGLNDSGKTFEQIADLLIFYYWIDGWEQDEIDK